MRTLLLSVVIAVCSAAKLPNGIKVCKLSDPDFNSCASKSATEAMRLLANGNKALGLPKLDPMFIKSLNIHSKGPSINLNQYFNDVEIKGLSNSKCLKFTANFQGQNCDLFVRTTSPEIEVDGPYKADGKILLFTLRGHGNGNVKLKNSSGNFTGTCERRVKEGKTYIKLTDAKMEMELEHATFVVDNLVDGNKLLSDEILKVLNENPLDFFREIKGDYERTLAEIFKQMLNVVFAKVPFEELFPQ